MDWTQLGAQLAAKAQRQAESERQAHAQRELQQRYRLWAEASLERALEGCFGLIASYATQLQRERGATFVVQPPRAVRLERAQAAHRVVSSTLGADTVDIYGQWSPDAPPALHLLLSRRRRERALRLICIPGVWLRPSASEAGFEAWAFERAEAMPLEALAYRAVRLLTLS